MAQKRGKLACASASQYAPSVMIQTTFFFLPNHL